MNSFQSTALEGLVDARQKLESQQQENQGVQSEFASLDEDSNIYKLIGPVLLKQDKNEAIMAVNGRLEFIEKEMYVRYSIRGANFFRGWYWQLFRSKRIETQIQESEEKADKKRSEVISLILLSVRSLQVTNMKFVCQILQFQSQVQQQQAAAASASAWASKSKCETFRSMNRYPGIT